MLIVIRVRERWLLDAACSAAASDEVEFQQSIWDASLFLFNPVVGRSASLFAFVLLAVNIFLQGSFAFYLIGFPG